MKRLMLAGTLLALVACDQKQPSKTPSVMTPSSPAAPATAQRAPDQPVAPEGLSDSDLFELGDIWSGDRYYVKGMIMATKPFDPNGGTLRLLSVECPALDEPLGPEARAFTQEFLMSRKAWLATPWKSKTDPAHGKAYVYRYPDGLCLNAELVRRGYARVNDVGFPEKLEMLREIEQEARGAKIGIWR